MASYFLLDGERRASIDAGRSFMSFPVEHSSGVCRLHRASSPESAVAYEESFIQRLHEESGLRLRHVRRGQWWRGVSDDQDVVVAGHANEDTGAQPAVNR